MSALLWVVSLLSAFTADVRHSQSLVERADLIELNHFYDDLGRHVYDQVIFYEWAPDSKAFQVRAWCLVDPKDCPNCRPWRTHHDDVWHVRWFDKDNRMVRQIDSDHFRETWTQVDPERANKKKLDEKLRTALIQPLSKFRGPSVQNVASGR
jgi:hypothetical protein